MALVPYNEDNIVLSTFHMHERHFTFLGHTLTIAQDWGRQGVAAVVWDAVSVGQCLP
jgi:hypothetical protein